MFICKICNDKKKSQRSFIYHIKKEHNIPSLKDYYIQYENLEVQYCIYCSNEASFNSKTHTYQKTCSNKSCVGKYANSISKQRIEEKYGKNINFGNIPGAREKSYKTKEKRYGDKNYNNPDKNKKTCLERYGVDNGSKTKEARQKISDKYYLSNNRVRREKLIFTLKEKYGVEWNSQNKEIHQKQIASLKKFREQEFLKKVADLDLTILENDNDKIFTVKCNKCQNVIHNISRVLINYKHFNNRNICYKCFPEERKYRSKGEDELCQVIMGLYSGKIEMNKKMLGYEVDIYIPDKNLAFEYNGLYWHSELYKDDLYHKNKKIAFSNENINLIHIWEDDWSDSAKKQIIISRIKSVLYLNDTIYARNCIICEIDVKSAREFVNKYHLAGYINSSIKVGLFFKDELVAVSLFGKRKLGKNKGNYELLRSCYKEGINVIGGLSKILKYFCDTYKSSFYSYVDCDWASLQNNSYQKAGFKFIHYTSPGYFWVINGKRENRLRFQKHALVKAGANINESEDSIMKGQGYYKIFNSGNLLYEYKNK
jgi:hypothetical protein